MRAQRVVPADIRTRRVVVRVVAVASLVGEVDAANERHAVVHRRSSSRGGSASAVPSRRVHIGSSCRPQDDRAFSASRLATDGIVASGAPAHTRTRTSTRSANSREQIAQHEGLAVACEREVGREVPAREVNVRGRGRSASAIAGSACAPSMRISIALPGRGGTSVAAHPPAGGSSASRWPILVRRRRWWRQICCVTCSPNQASTGKSARPTRRRSGATRVLRSCGSGRR